MKEEHGANYRSFGGAVVISGTVSNAHFINCSYMKKIGLKKKIGLVPFVLELNTIKSLK